MKRTRAERRKRKLKRQVRRARIRYEGKLWDAYFEKLKLRHVPPGPSVDFEL